MNLYSLGNWYSYTPDIEVEKKDDKYGIVYLPTGETLLPFEYENILVNGDAINNFIVAKNGLFGAVHMEGIRDNKNDLFMESPTLPPYREKPILIYDLPCEYDYFNMIYCGQFVFYNNNENVYLHTDDKNTVIRFEEIYIYDYSVWGKKNNTLYLVSLGKIEYEEPFTGFRFRALERTPVEYRDFENNDRLIKVNEKFTLITSADYLTHSPQKNFCFDGRIVEFGYYSEKFDLTSSKKPCLPFTTELYGIREKSGVNVTYPFAHTIQYVGKNRFIANGIDGKFDLFEIECFGQVETDDGKENLYASCPKLLLKGYDYVYPLGNECYEFIRENDIIVFYNANDGKIKNTL